MSNAERQKRYRERRNASVTQAVTHLDGTVTESVTLEGMTVTRNATVTPKRNVRLNPRTGKPYGPNMAALPSDVLAEYEHHRRPDVLVIHKLPMSSRVAMYRALHGDTHAPK